MKTPIVPLSKNQRFRGARIAWAPKKRVSRNCAFGSQTRDKEKKIKRRTCKNTFRRDCEPKYSQRVN